MTCNLTSLAATIVISLAVTMVLVEGAVYGKVVCKVLAFPTGGDWLKISRECADKLPKLDSAQGQRKQIFGNSSLEEIAEAEGDGCFRECMYKGLGLLTPEGEFDKSQTDALFEGPKISPEILKTVTDHWTTCTEQTETLAKEKELDTCKTMYVHNFCFQKAVMNIQVDC